MRLPSRIHHKVTKHYDMSSPATIGRLSEGGRDEWRPERTERALLLTEVMERIQLDPGYLQAQNAENNRWDEIRDAVIASTRVKRALSQTEITKRVIAACNKDPKYLRLSSDAYDCWNAAFDAAVVAIKADRKIGRRLLTDRFRRRPAPQRRGRRPTVTDAVLVEAVQKLPPRQRRNISEAARWLARDFPLLQRDSLRRRLGRLMKKVGIKSGTP